MHTPGLFLPRLLALTAARVPDRTAFVCADHQVSYREFHRLVRRAAAGFQACGVAPGDRVALLMANSIEFAVTLFALWEIGGVAVPTCPVYSLPEASAQWNNAGVKLVVSDARGRELAAAAAATCAPPATVVNADCASDRFIVRTAAEDAARWMDLMTRGDEPTPFVLAPDDLACLQYTGGTTGLSKGAMLTHSNLAANVRQSAGCVALGRVDPEVLVAALPMFHIFALTCVVAAGVAHGATVLIVPRFEVGILLELFRRWRPTIFHGVPTMFVGILNSPDATPAHFDSLRICMSGGAPLPVPVMRAFQNRMLRHGRISEGYGLSETSPVTHANPVDGAVVAGSIGRPVADTEVRIVDIETGESDLPIGEVGELLIRGPQVMVGYWRAPEETACVLRDGWLHTGDIGYRDADGYYYLVDRKKDLIIAGGFNVYPREVEESLFLHPAIQEALVIGVPDPYRGETVKAFVVCRSGMTLTSEEVLTHCRSRLAPYKVPRLVEFRATLPKSGVGKYLRRELRREEEARMNGQK